MICTVRAPYQMQIQINYLVLSIDLIFQSIFYLIIIKIEV